MYIRKIAVAAGLATGAALALAPLASADTPITSTVDTEIAALNSLFESESALAGVPTADIIPGSAADPFDTIAPAAIPTVQGDGTTLFDYLIYGVDPSKAGLSTDPGSFELFNGALGKFDDALNVELYALENNGAIDPNDADFIGSASSIDHAQSLASATDAAEYFYNFGVGDLSGFFQTDLSFLDLAAPASSAAADPAAFDIGSTLTSEITSLNGLFSLDATLAGIPSTDIIQGSGPLPFDTIDPTNTNSIFDTLVFGLNPANVTDDPGSYDVLNGALGEFDNAYNVGLFSLLDPTGTFDPTDIIGTHADLLNGTVSEAITGFLQLGVSDLAGFF